MPRIDQDIVIATAPARLPPRDRQGRCALSWHGRSNDSATAKRGCQDSRGRRARSDVAPASNEPSGEPAQQQEDEQVLSKLPGIAIATHRLLAGAMLSLVLTFVPFAPAIAQAPLKLTNTAMVKATAPVTDADETNNTDSAVVEVSAAATYNFCPGGGEIYSIGRGGAIWRHEPGLSGPATEVTELGVIGDTLTEALMVDPVRNRLLYWTLTVPATGGPDEIGIRVYDGNGGGWSSMPIDFPPEGKMGAVAPDGRAYIANGAGSVREVLRLDPLPGSTGYTATKLGTLEFDEYSGADPAGDMAFDADGVAWIVAGKALYSADLSAGDLRATKRADLSAIDDRIDGVAFVADGRLLLAEWRSGISPTYYLYDLRTGEVSPGPTAAEPLVSDLASCAFPTVDAAELTVTKTLSEVNDAPYTAGTPVLPGDTLTYNIKLANGGGTVATLAPGDVDETLPTATTVVTGGDNDFSCSGTACTNIDAVTVAAGKTTNLGFVVEVVDPLPAGTDTIHNAVAVKDVDCDAAGNDCIEDTAIGSTVTVAKTSDVGDGTAVKAGDTITYTITVSVANADTPDPVKITDTLGDGLTFGAVVSDDGFTCNDTASSLTCTLEAGATTGDHPLTYTAKVDQDATTSVTNTVETDTGTCTTCSTTNPLQAQISVAKTADPVSGSDVLQGQTLTYTVTVDVSSADTTEDLRLTDTLGPGLTFGAVKDAGDFSCTGTLVCTLKAGAKIGSYAVTYTATVDQNASGTVGNQVAPDNQGIDADPVCTSCTTQHNVVPAEIVVTKGSNPAPDSTVSPGDTIEYTLTVTVGQSTTSQPLTLTDKLGDGLTFVEVTDDGGFTCTDALTCTLPAPAAKGPHTVTYTAKVDADATGTVGNTVAASNPPGGDPDPECATCTTEHKIVPTETTVTKTANPATGSTVLPGDTIEYTLTVAVAKSATTEDIDLADTLGDGLTFGEVKNAGVFKCSGGLDCTLPAGTAVGSYKVVYTATVDPDATGTVGNKVAATNAPNGDPAPVCDTCATEHKIKPVAITVVKSADPAAGAEVRVGDTIAYTVAVTVANSATTEAFTLTDTLGPGLAFGKVTDAGKFACTGALECELPVGTLPGDYAVSYTATVGVDAKKQVRNDVAAKGGGGSTPDCSRCSVEHLLADPKITISKSSNPAAGAEVHIGDSIEYTLTALVENSSTLDDAFLVDDPGVGLDIQTLPAGCTRSGSGFRCALPAGTAPGTASFTYTATVNADAGDTILNLLTGESQGKVPECEVCEIRHKVVDQTSLRITKAVSARSAKIGDILRYTLTIENVGARNLVDGTVLDTPPTGFSYVDGSMSVVDGDGAFNLSPGLSPLRIGGLDIPVGDQATVVYLLRVGAGVRAGVYVNEAVAVDAGDDPVSNVATAQVVVESDPLLDDSLVFGTVYDDRDGDGWQDSAALKGVHVQGGFDPGLYIPGTTTVDRGQGPVAEPDASAPLLHGIDLGAIAGRESIADKRAMRQVVVRQRLREPTFTGDFVLTSDQGVTLRMDAEGKTTLEREGEAAKGLGAGEPVVERSIARVEDGYEVAYTIGNAGIDERGIPGVRIASVEGLLIETDQYGRYHLTDVQGGEGAHGRNFILKVDPATLPAQTAFTTENPLVRRITPGVPVRFGFGVKLPVEEIPGTTQVLELQLGEVFFASDSAELRPEYMPAIAKMAEQVDAHGGGEVVITAEGGNEPLAFARAEAVRDALVAKTGKDAAGALTVSLRTKVDDPHSLVAMVGGSETLLGTVLFDTDRSTIRPEFEGLLDSVAARLDAMGGGQVGIVGHTDVRASHDYNAALGLRRAQAVFDALAKRLSPEARAHLRVQSSNDPNAPLGTEHK
jgi:fimbrial isopeptide formation D2 family protein/uncharacterized repeat protein (TIGR01451 family)